MIVAPGLNVLYCTFKGVEFNFISDTKWLRPQQQQSGQEVLQDVLKGKPDRHAADTQQFNEIAGLEGGRDN